MKLTRAYQRFEHIFFPFERILGKISYNALHSLMYSNSTAFFTLILGLILLQLLSNFESIIKSFNVSNLRIRYRWIQVPFYLNHRGYVSVGRTSIQ